MAKVIEVLEVSIDGECWAQVDRHEVDESAAPRRAMVPAEAPYRYARTRRVPPDTSPVQIVAAPPPRDPSALGPAPWHWKEDLDSEQEPVLLDANGAVVCNFGWSMQYYPTEGSAPTEADARLIAAAPALLALVMEAADFVGGTTPDARRRAAWEERRAALLDDMGLKP